MFEEEFNFVKHSSYEDIKNKIEEKKKSYENIQDLTNDTFKIIKENPFNENTVSLLLEDGWVCNPDYCINNCIPEEKIIKLDKELTSQGEIYDFYERDLVLMHELNHAWYSRFKVYYQVCLGDSNAIREFENRLINEFISRTNRANPWILKKAVEGFGLEPQIYDVTSRMAFKENPHAKISLLAKKDNSLLKKVFIDGPDNHYYKDKLEKSLNKTPNKFWGEFLKYKGFIWQRTRDFLIDRKIINTSALGNYALFDNNEEIKIIPCFEGEGEYYLKNKKDALNYVNYLNEVEKRDLKLVKIQEVS